MSCIAAALAAALSSALPAHAAYPGHNGRIAYADFDLGGIWTMDPDGTDQTPLTTEPSDGDPVWSPDGTRIAFSRGGALHVMNANGSGASAIGSPPVVGTNPTWSPDGSRLAFIRAHDLWTVGVDGTQLSQLTDTPAREAYVSWSPGGNRLAFASNSVAIETIRTDGTDRRTVAAAAFPNLVEYADWSPDGKRIVFQALQNCDGDYYGGLSTAQADGTGDQPIEGESCDLKSEEPSWSPDGTRIAFRRDSSFATIRLTDGQYTFTNVTALQPDWQPLPASTPATYVRPRGATPFRVPLVPAAKPCTAPNREHGPPLAFGSCAPVRPESPNLTVSQGDARLRSTGFVRMDVIAGTPGPPDNDNDAHTRINLTNVMNASDFSDYTGELVLSLTVRRTDRELSLVGSTTQDFQFAMPVQCTTTADTFLGSTCDTTTTLNALVVGAVRDDKRTIWALDKLRLFDGGTDGDAQTEGDNSLFATQGVFVP